MATAESIEADAPNGQSSNAISKSLSELLADVLPSNHKFNITHIFTPPTSTEALYSAPPGQTPDRTYCETHFLTLSTTSKDESEVLVYAIEILIYTTFHSTTLFVSKADSSGYLHLLKLPPITPSPIKSVTTTFLQYLLKERCRPGVQTIVSLFARAQDQYLFARSIENTHKHVLDDRQLIKWWCRNLDPLISASANTTSSATPSSEDERAAKAYLTIPGLTPYESTSFLPPSPASRAHWSIGDPLKAIIRHDNTPPRCVIPHFPDDPKSRYLDELDDELLGGSQNSQNAKANNAGEWRSIKTLEAFWEMMAFRQECSAGRLVGFVWVVFPGDKQDEQVDEVEDTKKVKRARKRRAAQKMAMKRTGPIVARAPRLKTIETIRKRPTAASEKTTYSRPVKEGEEKDILDEKDYHRTNEMLLSFDFSTLKKAQEATLRWAKELRTMGIEGTSVTGKSTAIRAVNGTNGAGVNIMVPRKKRKAGDEAPGRMDEAGSPKPEEPKVNVLGAGMIRKKPKTAAT